MPKLKTISRALRQAFAILFITLFLAEIAFRVFNYFHPSFMFHDASYNRFRGKPHGKDFDFRLNSRGFKDVEFDKKKEEGAYRILGIGDSFAFGVVPYKDNYLTLLEEGLNRNGRRVELINMGIPGIGPKDYYALLMDEGLELKPDMVLVSFFIGNDFLRETEERKLYSYSYVASFINYLITLNNQPLSRPDVYNDDEITFNDAKYVSLESERSDIYNKRNQSFENDLAEAMSYLVKIKQQCAERGIDFALVLIPDEVQVNKALQSRVMQIKAFNLSADDFDFALPDRLLAAKLKEQNVRFLDLLDPFASASSQTRLYKPNDTHWNIAGNRLAAELIQENLFDDRRAASPVSESAPSRVPSSYEGFHDETDCASIKGWAWDTLRPNDPVKVEIYDGETLVATVSADLFRKDLLDAHKGNGAHAFAYPVPARLKDGKPHVIRLKVAGANINLTGTSKQINCGPG
jgi:hypothetical protein